jgi:ribosomal protein S18 acetylase RimI-like enzyme
MSTYTYRDANADDAETLAAFARENWAVTFAHVNYPPADLAAYLEKSFGVEIQCAEIADPKSRYRLAFDGEGIVGYCMMGVLTLPVDDARGVELHRLYVAQRAKGAGVADVLMDDCIAWARGKGASALYLSVWENNERAQRFYRRFGFADHGAWDFMVGSTADRDLIWRLAL